MQIKVTKNILRKGVVAFGLTKGQMICIVIAVIIAIGLITAMFTFNWNMDITMFFVFLEIAIIAGTGIIKINGSSLLKYIFLLFFLADDVRPHSSQGVFTRYDVEKEKSTK